MSTVNRIRHGLAVTSSYLSRFLAAPCVLGMSMLLAALVVTHVFGVHAVLSALAGANPALLVAALSLSITNELLRAQRARLILQGERPIRFARSYAPMVLGHGLADMVPLVPAGPALRALLTERIAGVPGTFAVGAYMLEGILDNVGPGVLIIYLLWVLRLPAWVHTTLVVALLQGLLLFVGLVVVALRAPRDRSRDLQHARSVSILRPITEIVRGVRTLLGQNRFVAVQAVLLSLLMTGVAAVQQLLFLRSFGLVASASSLVLSLVLTLAAGSVPIKLPGFGTIAATMVLQLAQIRGPGAGGYIVLSRAVAASLTPTLALLLLAWWMVTGRLHHLNLRAVLPRHEGPSSHITSEDVPLSLDRIRQALTPVRHGEDQPAKERLIGARS